MPKFEDNRWARVKTICNALNAHPQEERQPLQPVTAFLPIAALPRQPFYLPTAHLTDSDSLLTDSLLTDSFLTNKN
jgi:hypothetical protein